MKTIVVLLAAWLVAFGTVAQTRPTVAQCASSVVRIVISVSAGEQEYGSGFIVGSTPDSVYIATAGHVLKQPTTVAKVWLEGIPIPLPARVRFFRYKDLDDLALLAVASRNFRYQRLNTYDDLTTDDDLWFVSTQAQDSTQATLGGSTSQMRKTVLPLFGEGAKQSADESQHILRFMLTGLQPGDSGSALLTRVDSQYAIVGMIIKSGPTVRMVPSPHTAISIAYIKSVFLPRLEARWQLPLLQSSN